MPRALSGRAIVLVATAVAGVVNVLGAQGSSHSPLRLLGTAAGLWLILGAPIALWLGLSRRLVSGLDSALLLALGFALLTDFVFLLAINYLPQLVGNQHPLTRIPIAAGFAAGNILLGAFSPESDEPRPEGFSLRGFLSLRGLRSMLPDGRLPDGLIPVTSAGAVCILLAIAGATRLNNGFGPGVSITAYAAVAAYFVLLVLRRERYSSGVLVTGVFCAGAALLLLTSLRGWLITGHDIQTEYEYFRRNYGGRRWEISLYPGAYNACLSITLLPIAFVQLTAVSGIGVFKIVLPLLFAASPAALFRATHNLAPRLVALLAAVFFVSFPTFMTDMPYLGRQEVAFVLLGAALVVATDRKRNLGARRLAFTALLGGVVLAHYSTSYVLLIVLGGAAAFDACWRLVSKLRGHRRRSTWQRQSSFMQPWIPIAAAILALLWAGPVTHTSGQLQTTLNAALQELQGKGDALGSSAASSSLFGGAQVSDTQRLSDYRDQTISTTEAARVKGVFLPLSTVDQYQTPVQTQPDMPLTTAGQRLSSIHIPVSSVNGVVRGGIAAGLQLLIVLGLAVAVFSRRRAFRPNRDQVALAVGTLGMLALLTVVPQFSVDYGLLRAFQQGIFFVGPFMAAGLLWALRWTRSAVVPVACAIVVGVLLDLSGALPRLTGGYPAQLALSNAGQYYDLYYPTQPQQTAAVWLENRLVIAPTTAGKQSIEANLFTYNEIQSVYTGPAVGTIFPTMISPSDYVLLGPAAVENGQDTINYRGSLVTYAYPRKLLDLTKNEIYSSSGVVIYR